MQYCDGLVMTGLVAAPGGGCGFQRPVIVCKTDGSLIGCNPGPLGRYLQTGLVVWGGGGGAYRFRMGVCDWLVGGGGRKGKVTANNR